MVMNYLNIEQYIVHCPNNILSLCFFVSEFEGFTELLYEHGNSQEAQAGSKVIIGITIAGKYIIPCFLSCLDSHLVMHSCNTL